MLLNNVLQELSIDLPKGCERRWRGGGGKVRSGQYLRIVALSQSEAALDELGPSSPVLELCAQAPKGGKRDHVLACHRSPLFAVSLSLAAESAEGEEEASTDDRGAALRREEAVEPGETHALRQSTVSGVARKLRRDLPQPHAALCRCLVRNRSVVDQFMD